MPNPMRFLPIRAAALALAAFIAIMPVLTVQAATPAQTAGEGESLFKERCLACHTIGGGPGVGPDLADVVARRDRAWLSRWIHEPDKMLATNDPIAAALLKEYKNVPMPNMALTEGQVAALIAYLERPGADVVALPQAALPAGDAAHGRALFTGASQLANGGPPCMSCHSIAGLGALGGGALGPDLTGAYATYGGDSGLAAFLESMPTVTMNAVWAGQPLSSGERDDLRAFLQEASVAQRPPEAVWLLVGLSVVGLALMLGLAQLIWRKRLVSVRRAMVQRARP